jgi:membrane protein YdbS with pleckstrin-like domain
VPLPEQSKEVRPAKFKKLEYSSTSEFDRRQLWRASRVFGWLLGIVLAAAIYAFASSPWHQVAAAALWLVIPAPAIVRFGIPFGVRRFRQIKAAEAAKEQS